MNLTKPQRVFLRAVRFGTPARVREMIRDEDADPNMFLDGTTLLHIAAELDRLDVVRVLVEEGAHLSAENEEGLTAREVAEDKRFFGVARFLDKCETTARNSVSWAFNKNAPARKVPAKKALAKKSLHKPSQKKPKTVKEWPDDDEFSGGDEPDLPVFTTRNLKDIFDPSKWTGKTDKMQELWQEVPSYLKEDFDFAAALSDAQRSTLQGNIPQRSKMKFKK